MHGVRNVPLDLEFRIVTNGLHPHHLVGLARFLINQILTSLQAGGIIPSMFLGSLPANGGATFNPAAAKAALAASGVGHPTLNLVYPSDIQVNGISFGDLAARVQQDLEQAEPSGGQ